MVVGKNKRLNKKGKGGKKKRADSFEKKQWFKLKMPKIGSIKVGHYGWIPANKTAQGILVEERLQDRVCTIRCGDLDDQPLPDNPENLTTATNLKLRIAKTDIKAGDCWLDFHGMELTRDKTCQFLKKWVTLIEASVDIKTTDNFVFRIFGMALTKKQDAQCKKTAYAKTSQVKRIRQRMKEIMNVELGEKSTKEFVSRILVDKCGDAFKKELGFIFPVKDACIRKVRLIKRPNKEDLRRIKELHDDTPEADVMED